ncbi:glycosyltransferase family 4 protein [Anaerosinus massiliensis]|uniref:glycosyltransferase family 4 protein n=1 Tax=Massilibacillus massiliensis TaxID=1806837 RepID=UPI000ABB01F6|nr:glycosyltransferase family 4 protein [Massilibacillus massiliensis]
MKVLNVNTFDDVGGAARAAYRIHKGLIANNVKSNLFVQKKINDDSTINVLEGKVNKLSTKLQQRADSLLKLILRYEVSTPWSLNYLSNLRGIDYLNNSNADIINLHWINQNFISVYNLQHINLPIVWTLHDSWAFTGGCHIPYSCKKYMEYCAKCEQLNNGHFIDLAQYGYKAKKKVYSKIDMTIVAPSKWLAKCVQESSLLGCNKIKVIPNGIDIQKYKPIDKNVTRDILSINKKKKIILFGAMSSTKDKNKGYQYLIDALNKIGNFIEDDCIEIIVFGGNQPKEEKIFNYKTTYLGRLYDDITLNILYSSADVFIAPSISENLPNTVMESIACGTPVVAFNIGGISDLINHKQNGYLAKPFESEDLARGIAYILEDKERWNMLSHNARKKVIDTFDINIVAKKYINLYEEILESRKNR